MNEIEIIVKLSTEEKLTENDKQKILSDIRRKVAEYFIDAEINFNEYRVYKTITNEDIANAILK